ncbi:MAG: hypothetical protein LBL91_05715, partial [Lachnospiraceae bacterium]|nr:hypothetical protein [Lachnospiraceae bacterium]
MTVKEIYQKLVKARRPIDFFGEVTNLDELKKSYHRLAKIVHPDIAKEDQRYLAGQAMTILNGLYNAAQEEYESGIYALTEAVDLYKNATPLFELDLDGTTYKFYEHAFQGEVANLYKGSDGENIFFLKVAIDTADNELIDKEFETLKKLTHHSLPIVETQLVVNGNSAF